MKIKEMLNIIIDKGKIEDMYKLNEMLDELICDLKEQKPQLYKEYKMKLYKLAYGSVLSEKMAEEIITEMEPYHMRWSLSETRQVQEQYGLDRIRDIDFWVVINSAYNDYKELFDDNLDMYVKFTKLFIMDKDGKEDKVYEYFMNVVKED